MERIPTALIGLLTRIYPDRYTHAEIDSLFLYCGAPENVPEGSKPVKVQEWLRRINVESEEPLKVLGAILDDFMERDASPASYSWVDVEDDYAKQVATEKQKIRDTLERSGLTYNSGGHITKGGGAATHSLDELVKKNGLSAVDIEIKRALEKVETDPYAAAHYAGNVLEASLKAYLDHHSIAFQESATLSDLWRLASKNMGVTPGDWDDKDLKKIGSGLHNVVDGIMHLRNRKSGSHGKSADQAKMYTIKPRHARLAVHSAHTVSAYVIELIDKKKTP